METQRRRVGSRMFGGLLALSVAVVLSACGGNNTPAAVVPTTAPTEAPTAAPAPTEAPTAAPAPTEEPSGAVGSLEEAQRAVIQIEAQGTFATPDEGFSYNVAGRGSGFIIDESGIAVTNNHVVTGAALLKVFVDGESRPRNARVLGVSECSDLAVIDLEGDGYPYLEWYEGDLKVGLDVFAAGYPLGDPEFTMTRGIVSKARADVAESWAAVEDAIEHDATINPGNSGGPLLTTDGLIAGINYAGSSETNQYFAISPAEARDLIETMRGGEDVTSLGINGEAFVSEDGSFSGIWASSIKSGSPADKAGVQPGDVVTKLERLVLATDGTMAEYCDILRSRSAEDTLQIEVIRPGTQQVLEGQINGRALEETFSFAAEEEELGVDQGGATTYGEYYTFTDESGGLSVEIPSAWSDTSSGTWVSGGADIPESIALTAAPSIDEFANTWTTPGVFIGASRALAQNTSPEALLDQNAFNESCTYDGRTAYDDGLYTGYFDTWSACGGTETVLIAVAFMPADGSFLGLAQVQVVSEADLEALDRIIDSFVIGQF